MRAYQKAPMSSAAGILAVLHACNPRLAAADPLLRIGRQPLIAHGILAASTAETIGRVIVITSRPEVAAVATDAGAAAIELQALTFASGHDPLLAEAVQHLGTYNDLPEIVVFIDWRFPLIAAADIDATLAALVAGSADAAIAVTPASGPLWRSGEEGAEAVPLACVETGAVFAVRTAACTEDAGRAGLKRIALSLMPTERGVAIEGPFPLAVIETLLAARAREQRRDRLPRTPAALVMDFDGVFTDNRVLVDETGREAVLCNRSDGLGLEQLRARGLPMLVLSKERNPVVQARCRKLQLECLQGVDDKRPALEAWCREHNLPLADVIYIGNDTNDLACFDAVGCAVAVADAHQDARRAADVILAQDGGRGALRELTDLLANRLASTTVPPRP